MKPSRYLLMVVLLLGSILSPLFAKTVHAQDSDPWSEVFDSSGNLRSDLVDLGITTETPSWMSIDLPFNQSLNLEANYHRYETADGNIVVLPSASTLFFMAMNPHESGLSDAVGMMGNGYGGLISFLGSSDDPAEYRLVVDLLERKAYIAKTCAAETVVDGQWEVIPNLAGQVLLSSDDFENLLQNFIDQMQVIPTMEEVRQCMENFLVIHHGLWLDP